MEQDQIAGILSGWNKIEADIRSGLHEDFGEAKDIQDILDIIHDLQNSAQTVSPLRELFNKHVTDTKNPHEVTVAINDLDLLNTMYNLYMMKYGMDMTLSEFGYALINIKRFATRADVNNSTNLDSIVNLDVMGYIVEKHNEAPDAHQELFRYRMPGTPLKITPADVFEPTISNGNILIVDRACTMNYHDINGRVKTAPVDTLAVDYSFNRPACPIFGPHRNIMRNSRLLTDIIHEGSTRNNDRSLFIVTPTDDTDFLLLFESATTTKHGFFDPIPEEITGVSCYYVYAYPILRRRFKFNLMAGGTIRGSAIFDCDLKESQVDKGGLDYAVTFLHDLPDGWYRGCIVFDATNQGIDKIEVLTLTATDDEVYQGMANNSMGFWQHQTTKTGLPAPPIFTGNEAVTVLGTKVRRDFTSIFNPIRGSMVIRALTPMNELTKLKSTFLRLGNNGTPNTSVVRMASNEIDPSRNRIVSYNMNNEILEMMDSAVYDAADPTVMKRIAFTYGLGWEGYAFTDQHGVIGASTVDSAVNQMETFFQSIYTSMGISGEVFILQLPQDLIGENDTDETLITGELANTAQYRVNTVGNTLELGYDSTTDTYLDGYLLSFKYYTVFSSLMNLEFLMDQYIPTA